MDSSPGPSSSTSPGPSSSTSPRPSSPLPPPPPPSLQPPPPKVLAKGIVLFPARLDTAQQVEAARCATQLGVLDERARCRNEKARDVHMLCIGRDWDPHRRAYAVTTPIPPLILAVTRAALEAAMALTDVGATFCADQCVVNYYAPTARLGLHDERDAAGAVVSISLGDTGEFVFKRSWSAKAPQRTIALASGDVLVFGGAARAIVHGVPRILAGTGPQAVRDVLGRDGRVNFNVRER